MSFDPAGIFVNVSGFSAGIISLESAYIGAVTVNAGAGNDTFAINALMAKVGAVARFYGHRGDDAFNFGDVANLSPATSTTGFYVEGNEGRNSLSVNNSANTASGQDGRLYYGINVGNVNVSAINFNQYSTYRQINYLDMTSVSLVAGSVPSTIYATDNTPGLTMSAGGGTATDIINVQRTAAGCPALVLPSAGSDTVTIDDDGADPGAAIFNASQVLSTLYIYNNARLTFSGSGAVLRTNALSLSAAAAMDLGANDLIWDYSGASPATVLRNWLVAGRGTGTWNGATGITSSAVGTNFGTTLGYAEATDIAPTYPATFAGQTIDSTTLLTRFTFNGDSNLDRRVDISDLGALASNWQGTSKTFAKGDFNYDGTVDISDLGILATNWQKSLPAPAGFPPSVILTKAAQRGGGMPFARIADSVLDA